MLMGAKMDFLWYNFTKMMSAEYLVKGAERHGLLAFA